jgi:hypothetical protein
MGKSCPEGTFWNGLSCQLIPSPTPSPTATAVPVCSQRKLNVQYGTMSSSMAFAAWPGASYSNPLMALGSPISFVMSDGQPAGRSFLGWADGYEVTGGGPTWRFVNGEHGIGPGHEYWFTVSYIESSTLCILQIRLQWDPPETGQNMMQANQIVSVPEWQKNYLEMLKQ